MTRQDISLHDKYDLSKSPVLLNGTQALVRLMMMQRARDKAAGLDTAGYVTGYRGSPLGAVDMQMQRAEKQLAEAHVTFQPGLNEDLAATAMWGTQQAEMRGEGKHDGVFGLWYGKGPGVDRSGDVMRHANMAGTSRHGGVIMAMGDDHTGESSTTCHQSDFAMVDAYMPIVSPAGVQEILDYGQYAWALSRFAGVWVGLKTMKDTVEVTSVVDGDPHRLTFVEPEFDMPEGGLNIRRADHWVEQEERMVRYKRHAAEAFSHANKMDKRMHGQAGAKIGFVAAGKNWLDLLQAFAMLGIDDAATKAMGITTYKIGQTFPLDMKGFSAWAEGLDLIVVVEEKRKLIEVQVKEAIFDDRRGRRVYGWTKGGSGDELFGVTGALDPADIAEKIGGILIEEGCDTPRVHEGLARLAAARAGGNTGDLATRIPYFCAGCPHNTSTKVPDGSRAYGGIGCHVMALWMDRDNEGYSHMGGEGANWVGEAPFSTRDHVFQNLGDGTYNHSGLQAIRFAMSAGTNITYKILYNDAVAMTGGQTNEGDLSADQICRELLAFGIKEIALVYDEKEDVDLNVFPKGLSVHERAEMPQVMERMKTVEGVSAIVYVQTCAAEKRRRRKRGAFPDPDKRIFINTDVCEGCGDCGVQSNCVALVPVETELGRKRAVDQSACNKDFSCLNGFCPSFVTVEGGAPRKPKAAEFDLPDLPEPNLPAIDGTYNVVITGVGGTGVVTIGAVLAMAAHVDGKGASMMEMAGLAQKGGAVHIHCRLANTPEDIAAIRVTLGECDALIGGDLVTSAGAKTLALMAEGRTKAAVNNHEVITGAFTRDTDFRIPGEDLQLALERRVKAGLAMFDATRLAEVMLGDTIYSNMVIFGAAWQMGAVPVGRGAILRAIELNGAKVPQNTRAFEIGRWAVADPDAAAERTAPLAEAKPLTLNEKIAFRAQHLVAYQSKRLAKRYERFVAAVESEEVRTAVAEGYHKLLAYKDEYEVARLLRGTEAAVAEAFEGDVSLRYHLAPPILSRTAPNGRPAKRAFGPWVARSFPMLARMKRLRGTWLDPFGRTEERRMERALIAEYEADMAEVLPLITDATRDAVVKLAALPLSIRGFGPVKQANAAKAAKEREALLAIIRAGGMPLPVAAE